MADNRRPEPVNKTKGGFSRSLNPIPGLLSPPLAGIRPMAPLSIRGDRVVSLTALYTCRLLLLPLPGIRCQRRHSGRPRLLRVPSNSLRLRGSLRKHLRPLLDQLLRFFGRECRGGNAGGTNTIIGNRSFRLGLRQHPLVCIFEMIWVGEENVGRARWGAARSPVISLSNSRFLPNGGQWRSESGPTTSKKIIKKPHIGHFVPLWGYMKMVPGTVLRMPVRDRSMDCCKIPTVIFAGSALMQ